MLATTSSPAADISGGGVGMNPADERAGSKLLHDYDGRERQREAEQETALIRRRIELARHAASELPDPTDAELLVDEAVRAAPKLRSPSATERDDVELEWRNAGWSESDPPSRCRARGLDLLKAAEKSPYWPHIEARPELYAGLIVGELLALRHFIYLERGLDPGDRMSVLGTQADGRLRGHRTPQGDPRHFTIRDLDAHESDAVLRKILDLSEIEVAGRKLTAREIGKRVGPDLGEGDCPPEMIRHWRRNAVRMRHEGLI
jgi:hypothetical protein